MITKSLKSRLEKRYHPQIKLKDLFFELINSKVVVTPQGMADKKLKSIFDKDRSKLKKNWIKAITYIFFVHSKDSQYKNVLMLDRKKIVCNDVLEDPEYYLKIEENKDFKELIEKFNQCQFTHNERLVEGAKKKIEEYLGFWNSLSITNENHKLLADTLTASEGLLKLQERLERMVSKESLTRQVGDGVSKMFEDG